MSDTREIRTTNVRRHHNDDGAGGTYPHALDALVERLSCRLVLAVTMLALLDQVWKIALIVVLCVWCAVGYWQDVMRNEREARRRLDLREARRRGIA